MGVDAGGGVRSMHPQSLQGQKEGTRFPFEALPVHRTIPCGLEFEMKFDLSLKCGRH